MLKLMLNMTGFRIFYIPGISVYFQKVDFFSKSTSMNYNSFVVNNDSLMLFLQVVKFRGFL